MRSLLQTAYNGGVNSFLTGEIRDTSASGWVGLGWVDNSSTHQITIMPTIAGDLNLDGSVDGKDLDIWRGSDTSGTGFLGGDANYDGQVDGKDLDIWKKTVGSVMPSSQNLADFSGSLGITTASAPELGSLGITMASVPEPGTLAVLATGLALFGCFVARRRRKYL